MKKMHKCFIIILVNSLIGCSTWMPLNDQAAISSLPRPPAGLTIEHNVGQGWSEAGWKPNDWEFQWKGVISPRGQCVPISATKKRCTIPLVVASHANWSTFIGEGEPHWIEIEQIAPHQIRAEWKFNIRSADQVRAAFDPDIHFVYRFFNSDNFQVGAFQWNYWRECMPVEIHIDKFVIPGNLDFVADSARADIAVEYRVNVKNC